MFREIRRSRQALPIEEGRAILHRNTAGVLSLHDEPYPYGVPISYAYEENSQAKGALYGTVYIHCSMHGHKLEAIGARDHVSFCVIDCDTIVPESFTTEFRSVIAFGVARVVSDDAEKRHGLELLAQKYSPGLDELAVTEIEGSWEHTCVIAIDLDYFSTKEAIELVRARGGAAHEEGAYGEGALGE